MMKTQEYIDARRAYLERLLNARRREEENLSAVDFVLFSRNFDRLISEIQEELKEIEHPSSVLGAGQETVAITTFGPCCGSVNPGVYYTVTFFQTVVPNPAGYRGQSTLGPSGSVPTERKISTIPLLNYAAFPGQAPYLRA